MKNKIFLMILIGLCIFSSCEKNASQSQASIDSLFPLTITDDEGFETVIDKKPEKIISLSPGITENICILGEIDTIVGRTSYCDNPPEILEKTDIGTLYSPNNEVIATLEPDLIIAGAHINPDNLQTLRDLGFNVIRLFDESSLDSLYENIITIGKILDKVNEAEEKVSQIKSNIASISEKVKDSPAPRVYYCVSAGDDGDFTAGRDTFINTAIEIAGGDNIAKDIEGWSYSKEALIQENPDIMIVSGSSGLAELLIDMEGYQDLDAVKNDKVYVINENYIDRFSGYIDEGILELAKIFHPDKFYAD